MNTANLDLTASEAFQARTQILQHQPQAHRQHRNRKKVKVSLRKKDTSVRDKRLGIALIVLILGLFVGALGFTVYHMAKGNAAAEETVIGYNQQ